MEDLRDAILACNDGNVFLTELPGADGEPRIRVIPARDPLPRTHPANCAFHSNRALVTATRAKEAFAVFPTPSGNTLVVPTKSFTSIRDFARRATKQEFADLFRAVFKASKGVAHRGAPLRLALPREKGMQGLSRCCWRQSRGPTALFALAVATLLRKPPKMATKQ